MIVAIDIGSTNLKVGLFSMTGEPLDRKTAPMVVLTDEKGHYYFSAADLWQNITRLIGELVPEAERGQVRAIGITSMAESGILVDTETQRVCTEIIPWFDTASSPQAAFIRSRIDVSERFYRSGLFPNAKQGLSKLLWLREEEPHLLERPVQWLSVSAYVAFCLTGHFAEDYSLAARTFAFDIKQRAWDSALIEQFDLRSDLFPAARHCTVPVGEMGEGGVALGLPQTARVYIAGHDQLAASLAGGRLPGGTVFNSIGTAETLIGLFPERELTEADAQSGFTYGRHLLPDHFYWMGGHGSSGRSVEWMRKLLDENRLPFEKMDALLSQLPPEPTGILFYPYLSGSGAPKPDSHATAALLGLTDHTGRAEILKAVLEGNAYQMEWVREAAEQAAGTPITNLTAVGGGTRNRHWMQLKANVSGLPVTVADIEEAALQGAALVALTGEGIFRDLGEVADRTVAMKEVFYPDMALHHHYQPLCQKFKQLYSRSIL